MFLQGNLVPARDELSGRGVATSAEFRWEFSDY